MKKQEVSEIVDRQKYREPGESHEDKCARIAGNLMDSEDHRQRFKEVLVEERYLPAGRQQAACGAARQTTAFNCYVSDTIPDDFNGIFDKAKEAGQTMRLGGGIGYDFSTLRPRGDRITTLDSTASGPVSFMRLYDAACSTVLSAGHRRGAQMGVLRVDHPDIEEFVTAKHDNSSLTNFNVSIGITDKFMEAVQDGSTFDLVFEGKVYKTVDAKGLWDKIMRSTWDWAEPGVLFIDTINRKNNLYYCETISATNPCGEQPLPPYGACLLGSLNLVKYTKEDPVTGERLFNYSQFKRDIPDVVRATDNVIDRTIYPLEEQKQEALNKRRMGLGLTGVANAGAILGFSYGSPEFKVWLETVMTVFRDTAYRASVSLAIEKGPFPLFTKEYCEGEFIKTLPEDIQEIIGLYGIRNSHLLSIAPTGTISLVADNVSSGIEPPWSLEYDRPVFLEDGTQHTFKVQDYAYRHYGIESRTADDISAVEHVSVLNLASQYVDSSVSKTCNVGDNVTFNEFKDIYMMAWSGGSSGCTTFRSSGKRFSLLTKTDEPDKIEEGAACFIDPETGQKECS